MEECIPLRGNEGGRSTPYTRRQGRWRKQPNHELEYLRQKVIDLEEELAVLRQPDAGVVLTGTLELGSDETWEDIAARQSSQANAALMENLKLRTVLKQHLLVSRTPEEAIDQHWRKASQELRWFTGGTEKCATNLSDELIYALLEEGMANQYVGVDKILEASEVTQLNSEFIPKLRVQQRDDDVSFYHRDVLLLPFPVSTVLGALHNSLIHGNAGRPMERCRKLLKTDVSVHATTVVKLHLPSARQVEVEVRLVQRTFPGATRTVFVWAAYVEIKGSMFARLEEKGWLCAGTLPLQGQRRRTRQCTTECGPRDADSIRRSAEFAARRRNGSFGLLCQVLDGSIHR